MQIDFQPALATNTTVHLPPLAALCPTTVCHPRVLLTFRATPLSLNDQDRIEIWTDGGSGTWRAIPFEPYEGFPGVLVATISVDVKDGSFGYTYRVVHASGETTWLGDMGGNGKVDLVSTEGDALWKGEEWLKFDKKEWEGFGIRVDDRNVPSGVSLDASDLCFAYVHPSTPPFATYHLDSESATSSAFALIPTEGTVLSSTTSDLVVPQGNPSSGPPAAYASYCGLGFSGGEQERTKAFRSLLAGHHGLEYLPRTSGHGHAVGLVCRDKEGKANRLIAYGQGEWDLSGLASPFALWDDESKLATTKPTLQLGSSLQTLDIVNLFELPNGADVILLGAIGSSAWTLQPESVQVEELTVDEVVQAPTPATTKPLGDTSDSGETIDSQTLGFNSGASETSATSVEDTDDVKPGETGQTDDPAPIPKKSILRFFWITLGFFHSLYWRTMTWFHQWTRAADKADEQTPLISEDEPQTYSQILPDTTEPTPAEPAPEEETIRVPETRKTVFPAHISALAADDVFLLASLDAGLVAEIKRAEEWEPVSIVEEDVGADSELKLLRVPLSGDEMRVRVRLA